MSEKEYQAYIDELHKQIDTLYEVIDSQTKKLDEYEEAIFEAFKKWSRL